MTRATIAILFVAVPACAAIAGIPDGRHLAEADGGAADGALDVFDARVDAGEGSADARSGWCATVSPAPLFCDDFDEGALSAVWHKQLPTSGLVEVDTTAAESRPGSLHVKIDDGGTPGGQTAYATTTFSETAVRIEVAFAFWPDSLVPDDPASYVMEIQVGQNTLSLYVNPSKSAWQEHLVPPDATPSFPDHNVQTPLPIGAWTDADVVVDLGATPAWLTVKYGGTTVRSDPLDPSWTAGPWSLTLGPAYLNDTTDTRSFHFDDVVVWTHP